MKTIQVFNRTPKRNRLLIRCLYKKILKRDDTFHFFFEPDLIIRTSLFNEVKKYLDKRKIEYKTYAYPYTKKGYGESKRWKYMQKFSETLYHTQAIFVLKSKRKDRPYFANRMHHCFLNQDGFSFYYESEYLLGQSAGYLYRDYKCSGNLITLILCKCLRFIQKLL
jgi:hypothetical protein